ncbi:MAG: alcohol dehydrogenase catalytic domain-containing protein [Nitrospirota bacterium]|nr:alcohol dehydrogenase catalytic domain-containing protein [Nitrospirota bacterium]
MKAVFFDNKLEFVEDYPVPEPAEDEALIRVSRAGICNTDLEIRKGYSGFKGIIGHEFVGVVEKINGKDRGLTGRRVVGEINCGCGLCSYCLRGLKNHCPNRKVLGILNKDGAMAEYITLPAKNLLKVPENITAEEAVFTEPLAAAFEITQGVHIKPTDKILVMGDGKLGLLCCLVLNLLQADLSLVGKHEDKLRIARGQNVKTILLDNLEMEKSYDTVVESTGSADGFEMALKLVKPGGTVVLKSTVAEGREMNLAPLVIDEITVVGSRCGPFKPALRALERKSIDVRPLITGIFPFERAKGAFEKAEEKGSLKVIIDFR